MLKETITYEDFDGTSVTEDLYFNLTKTEMMDYTSLEKDFEDAEKKIKASIAAGTNELTVDEIKMILDIVKKLLEISYGERSTTPEGKIKFAKRDGQAFKDWKDTAGYDAFLWWLFEDESRAIRFMISIMPKDVREEMPSVEQLIEQVKTNSPELTLVTQKGTGMQAKVPTSELPVAPAPEEPDVDTLLLEMPEDEVEIQTEKKPISAKQVEWLRTRLTEAQLAKHLENRIVVE